MQPACGTERAGSVRVYAPKSRSNSCPSRLARPALILVGLLLFGLAARCRQYLANPSYWYDEAYRILNVIEKPCADLLGPLSLEQASPPVYLWTLRGLYLLAGCGEWALRLPAAATAGAALLLMVPLARRAAGNPGWLWA